MTNTKTIKPFCVNMMGATEQEIRDLHKMCVNAGGEVDNVETSSNWFLYAHEYNFMGVTLNNCILATNQNLRRKLLTLSEVPQHLGLTPTEEPEQLKWTVSAQEQGIELQAGMTAVTICNTPVKVNYIGDNLVHLSDLLLWPSEMCLLRSQIKPFEDELTPKEKQHNVVVESIKESGMSTDAAESIYKRLESLGVFKEEE